MLTQFYGFSPLEIVRSISEQLFRETLTLFCSEYDIQKIYNIYEEFRHYQRVIKYNLQKTDVKDRYGNPLPEGVEDFKRLQRKMNRTEEEERIVDLVVSSPDLEFQIADKVYMFPSGVLTTTVHLKDFLEPFISSMYKLPRYIEIITEVLNAPELKTKYLEVPIYNISSTNKYWFYKAIDKLVSETNTDKDSIENMLDNEIKIGSKPLKKERVDSGQLKKDLADKVDVEYIHQYLEDFIFIIQNSFVGIITNSEYSILCRLFAHILEYQILYEKYNEDVQSELEMVGIYTLNPNKAHVFLKVLSTSSFINSTNLTSSFSDIFKSLEVDRELVRRYLENRDCPIGGQIQQEENYEV